MKLTRIERWMLSNQYRILEHVDPSEGDYYRKCRDVLVNGYELEYDWLTPYILDGDDALSADQCREVRDILDMFRDLHFSYEALDDKSGMDDLWLKFYGFDGNSEAVLIGYVDHLFSQDKFRESKPDRADGTNSHMPTLDIYRRMLAAWRPLAPSGRGFRKHLTKAEMIEIANQAPHPDSELGKLRDVKADGPVQ